MIFGERKLISRASLQDDETATGFHATAATTSGRSSTLARLWIACPLRRRLLQIQVAKSPRLPNNFPDNVRQTRYFKQPHYVGD